MSQTIAALIRAHQRDPKSLYVAPSSDRESAPGRYDRNASQKSPALDRRQIRDAARALGSSMPALQGQDLSGVEDYEDLQDLLDAVNNPGIEIPDIGTPVPLDPIETPELPGIPPTPLPAVPGQTMTVLHSGSVSISENGGATWINATGSLVEPLGFVVSGSAPVVVVNSAAIQTSSDYLIWNPVTLPQPESTRIPIVNGDFEDYTKGWVRASGDSPRTQSTTEPPQREGSESYLTRDWIVSGTGAFQIVQSVPVPEELRNGTLTLGADIRAAAGAKAKVEVSTAVKTLDLFNNPTPAGRKKIGSAWTCNNVATVGDSQINARMTVTSTYSDMYSWIVSDNAFMLEKGYDWEWLYIRVEFFDQSGNPVTISGSFDVLNLRSGEYRGRFNTKSRVHVEDGHLASIVAINGETLEPSGWGGYNGIAVPNNASASVRVTINPTQRFGLFLTTKEGRAVSIIGTGAGNRVVAASVETTESNTWQNKSDDFQMPAAATGVDITITGTGNPADVWIDNVTLTAARPEEPVAIAGITEGVYVIDGMKLLKIGVDGTAQLEQTYPAAATEIAATADGTPFALCSFGVMTAGGRIVPRGEDMFARLVGGYHGMLALTNNGWLCAVEDNEEREVEQLSQLAPGTVVHYSRSLSRFISVAPSGAAETSEDGIAWAPMTAVPISAPNSSLRITTANNGRIICWAPGWTSFAYFDSGSSAWKASGSFDRAIVDISA